jgi:hypothetical protein
MTEKPAIETMTSQERFNSAVLGWINEATEAIEGSGAVSDSAKRLVDEMRCQCGDAYQAVFSQRGSPPQPVLTDEEREAIELAAGDYLYHQDPGGRAQHIRATLLGLLERLK